MESEAVELPDEFPSLAWVFFHLCGGEELVLSEH